jgi:hypothetical protein
MLENEKLFYCYSIKLFHFLKEQNFYYLQKDKHRTTGKFFWVFKRTEKFENALGEYHKVRDTFK